MFKVRLIKSLFGRVLLGVVVIACGKANADAALDPISPRLATADPAQGEKIFLQCRVCHVAEKGASPTVGSNLWGIVGRPVASKPDFSYSDSLKAIGGEWDYEKLNRYLFDPKAMAPQTRMAFTGIKPPRQRADLIAHLRTLADDPVPLPEVPSEDAGQAYRGLPRGEGEEQDWQNLPPAPGREEVFYTCNLCHSLMLVTQQGMSRDRWDETLEWMVEEQGMSEIEDAATRNLILDYLATHFGSG